MFQGFSRADTLPRLIDETSTEEVESVCAGSCKEIAKRWLGEVSNGNVIWEFHVALNKVENATRLWFQKEPTGHSSSVGVPSARKMVLSWSISLSPGR